MFDLLGSYSTVEPLLQNGVQPYADSSQSLLPSALILLQIDLRSMYILEHVLCLCKVLIFGLHLLNVVLESFRLRGTIFAVELDHAKFY